MFAVGDTGDTRTLLTEEAARPYRLVELDPQGLFMLVEKRERLQERCSLES